MTPKEKAQELIDKFHIKVHDREGTSAMNEFEAKQCALISVEELIKVATFFNLGEELLYLEEVKQEILIFINTKQHIIEIMIADENDDLYNQN